MKITALETIRVAESANLVWLQVHTRTVGSWRDLLQAQDGRGLCPRGAGAEGPRAGPRQIDLIAKDATGYLGFRSIGAEVRGNSALDIALGDLFGKITGQPLAQPLGRFSRDNIRTYHTCAGSAYMRKNAGQSTANWGLKTSAKDGDDLSGFLHRADELALDLLCEGITATKIWPFDPAAEASGGVDISTADLKTALKPFEKIRAAVGDRIDIMVEFHSLWQLLPAIRIAKALVAFSTTWHEDRIKMDSLASLKRHAEALPAPICASETLGRRCAFRDLIETGAAGVIMLDLSWCAGVSEARKIAAMAEAWHLPVAPHDCTGPVVLAASTHLSLNAPNALIQESVRTYCRTWYRDLATGLPEVEVGFIGGGRQPGHGVELQPDLGKRFSLESRTTAVEDL
jgi:L-alanine-DL-glutamate epimerase-like enolase superfamily enzyme